jgi:hypothetical protein
MRTGNGCGSKYCLELFPCHLSLLFHLLSPCLFVTAFELTPGYPFGLSRLSTYLSHTPLTVCFYEITSLLVASLYLSHVLTSCSRDPSSCQCHLLLPFALMIAHKTSIMATAINTATATATEAPDAITRRPGHSQANGSDTVSKLAGTRPRYAQKKYRHVAAVHSRPRTSCLSHDSPTTPSFIGFRNLMVIVLSESAMSLILSQFDSLGFVLT